MKYFSNKLFSIAFHPDFESDLDDLWETDEDAAALVVAFFEEAKTNQSLLDNLTRNKFVSYGDWPYSVEVWASAQSRQLNLWRLKLLGLEGDAKKLRIIYAFHPREYRYYVLGIVPREFNYDPQHPISQRVVAAYRDLDLPES